MTYDFDEVIDRRRSESSKWHRYPPDVLPLWVADMDFRSPEPVLRALHERVEHGVFGYGVEQPEFHEVLVDRLRKRYGWTVSPEAVLHVPGVIPGFNLACRALASPGQGLLLQPPAVAAAPGSPSALLAGCRPLALLRWDEGSGNWTRLPLGLPAGTPEPHTPRISTILVEEAALWCGVEVGGVFRSRDGGHRWEVLNEGLPSLDIHALARSHGARGEAGALVAAGPRGIARYEEEGSGGRWRMAEWSAPSCYCRALAPVPGCPGMLLCGFGDGPPGTRGAVACSDDHGRAWRPASFPEPAASSVWSVAVAPAGLTALAGAIGGEIYSSEDGGRGWRRLGRRFGETRAVLIA